MTDDPQATHWRRTAERLQQELATARQGLLSRDARIMRLEEERRRSESEMDRVRGDLRERDEALRGVVERLRMIEASRGFRLLQRYVNLAERPGPRRLHRLVGSLARRF